MTMSVMVPELPVSALVHSRRWSLSEEALSLATVCFTASQSLSAPLGWAAGPAGAAAATGSGVEADIRLLQAPSGAARKRRIAQAMWRGRFASVYGLKSNTDSEPHVMTDTFDHDLPAALTAVDFTGAEEPFRLFADWFAEAKSSEPNDPNAMAVASVDETGLPNLRMVLLKGFDEAGFVFYTNFESRKGREILAHPKAALLFHWKSLRRQVRIRGTVEVVSAAEADEYYASRPRGSRIGAWASRQSRPLESRFALEKAVADYTMKFGIGEIPRPSHWSGFRVVPVAFEFWHDRPFRLHDRIEFTRETPGAAWTKGRLYP